MSSAWVSDSFPHYRLDKGTVLEFLKEKFSKNNTVGDNDFGLNVVLP